MIENYLFKCLFTLGKISMQGLVTKNDRIIVRKPYVFSFIKIKLSELFLLLNDYLDIKK